MAVVYFLAVPEDVAVLGFDNIPAAEEAGLSTLHLPMNEIGERSVLWFLDEVVGNNGSTVPQLRLPCTTILRQSTGSA